MPPTQPDNSSVSHKTMLRVPHCDSVQLGPLCHIGKSVIPQLLKLLSTSISKHTTAKRTPSSTQVSGCQGLLASNSALVPQPPQPLQLQGVGLVGQPVLVTQSYLPSCCIPKLACCSKWHKLGLSVF